jgi:calmodulin
MSDEGSTYDGIDFEEIQEICGLEKDEIKVLKICFNMFDVKKVDFLSADDLDDILRAMGFRPSKEELKEILEEIDEDGSGEIEFGEFCQLCAKFLVEEPDEETMKKELKEAFRVYDKEANGFITTDVLREIIAELDTRLTKDDLDGIIEEIDEDGSGTMDFDEFCQMMMS